MASGERAGEHGGEGRTALPATLPDALAEDVRAVLSLTSVPHILELVRQTTGVRFAAVARVTRDRWVTCASLDGLGFGLGPGDEIAIDSTMCQGVRDTGQLVAFDDAETDAAWCDHPIPRQFGIRSYISMPIVRGDGSFFGTLCAIDAEPRALSAPTKLAVLDGFARLIAQQLDDRETLAQSQKALLDEQAVARLREEFIAVLGHDLRNPLASMASGLRLLEREGASERAARTIALMRGTIDRMNALIDNLLDLARGRLGAGIPCEIVPFETLRDEVEQVVGEIRAGTGREIELRWQDEGAVPCDPRRIGQLVSNLVANAVAHGAPDHPVRVEARRDGTRFRLEVENRGEPIPADVRASLFEPFFRGDVAGPAGLGLGLYIATEIARAHGGVLDVESDRGRTRFVFSMPC